ncbi:hypothetical protein C7212DRAFT_281284 [Tuber magnatum]|uniref:Uncharacterized protein n=1 Tax=Tuber magnatum TaxID=42249 RepID=A0A317SV28_9PEZI|nr:hypothetical protein C7212DRAFT_281284 [Tuber magnatum]
MAEENQWLLSLSALKAVKKNGPDARTGAVLPGLAICNSLIGPRRPGGWEPSDTVGAMNEAFGHLLRMPGSVRAPRLSQASRLKGPVFGFGRTDSLEITHRSPKDETDKAEGAGAQVQSIQSWGAPEPMSRWSSSSDEGSQADLQKM